MTPLLAAVLLVRDEEQAIAPTIRSVAGVVDRIVIVDTGSTDGTVEAARALCAEVVGGDFAIYRAEFVDYAQARNRALDLAAAPDPEHLLVGSVFVNSGPATWALSLSADEVLREGPALRNFLSSYGESGGTESALLVELRTESDVSLYPRLLRLGSSWRYEGAIDERPVDRVNQRDPSLRVPGGVAVEHRATDPARRLRRLIERDVPILRREMEEHPEEPVRQRAMMLLADKSQAIASAVGRRPGGPWVSHMATALGLYIRRIEAGGDPVEVEYATARLLGVAEMMGLYSPQDMITRLGPLADSKLPEAQFLIASNLSRLDASAAYERAVGCARITRERLREPTTHPTSREILWKSHLIAAHCARALGNAEAAKKSATAGIESGGPAEQFKEFFPPSGAQA